jgi:aminoglycoside phosphotransferase (APT) family kinase protein
MNNRRGEQEVDLRAVLATVGITGEAAATPISGGTDTSIWQVTAGDRRYALRLFGAGREAGCQREVAVMEVARAAGVPVPEVYATGVWNGRAAMLLEWGAGEPLIQTLVAHPQRAEQLGRLFGATQAAIHRVPAPPILQQSDRSWIDWYSEDEADERPLREHLRALASQDERLLHLDYHPYNVMTDGERITAVLDWTNAHAGDARADFARTFSILLLVAGSGLPNLPASSVMRRFMAGWRSGYRQVGGRLADLAPFCAWAGVVLERDLAQKVSSQDLARIHRWAERWKRRSFGMSA